MKSSRRPWTRGERSLFLTPLLLVIVAGVVGWWRSYAPLTFSIPNATSIDAVEWAPDSQRLVVFAKIPNGKPDGRIQGVVYDVQARETVCELVSPPLPLTQESLWFNWPSWSPDGTRIVSGYSNDRRGKVIANRSGGIYTGKPYNLGSMWPRGNPTPAPQPGKIALWDAQQGTLLGNWPYAGPNETSFSGVSFSPDGQHLVGHGHPRVLFDATSGKLRHVGSKSFPRGRLDPAQKLLALDGIGKTVFEVRDMRTGKSVWKPAARSVGIAMWNNQSILGVLVDTKSYRPRDLLLWDGKTRRSISSLPFTEVSEFAFHPQVKQIGISDVDVAAQYSVFTPSTLIVWNFERNILVWKRKLNGACRNLAWSKDGKWLCVAESTSQKSVLWVFNAQGEVHIRRQYDSISRLRWAPNSQKLAVMYGDTLEILTVTNSA